MQIISVRDKENNRWKKNTRTHKTKKIKVRKEQGGGDRSYSERVRAKWFCCAFKLGFLQLLCKASLISKSNLELALSVTVK